MKISKKKLERLMLEEVKNTIKEKVGKSLKAPLNEGHPPGQISGEDLTAAITLAIDDVFQEHRPDLEATRVAFSNISRSIDAIFKESYAAGARAAAMLGAEDFEQEFTPRSGQLTVPGLDKVEEQVKQKLYSILKLT